MTTVLVVGAYISLVLGIGYVALFRRRDGLELVRRRDHALDVMAGWTDPDTEEGEQL